MSADKYRKKQAAVQVLAEEILKESGEEHMLSSWSVARTAPFATIAHVNTTVPVKVDLSKTVSKSVVCEHIIDSLDKLIELWQKSRQKLQQIQQREET